MTPVDLRANVDGLARDSNFSGVVSVRVGDEVGFEAAYGFADREHQRPNTPDTRFGLASGTQGFTALTVMRLIEDQALEPTTGKRYGLGFWLDPTDTRVSLEGCNAGVSFLSIHDQSRDLTATVVSNSTEGALPVVRALEATVEP